jgi:hypothetical protein
MCKAIARQVQEVESFEQENITWKKGEFFAGEREIGNANSVNCSFTIVNNWDGRRHDCVHETEDQLKRTTQKTGLKLDFLLKDPCTLCETGFAMMPTHLAS